jgi:hypothetical protein
MRTRQWTRMALALAIAGAACAPVGGSGKRSFGKPAPPAVMVVSNHNFADMNLYVVQSGMRVRLGTVTGLTTRRFSLPREVTRNVSDLRIFADPIGGSQTYLSPPVRVHPGQSLELTLGASLNLSSLAVWNR